MPQNGSKKITIKEAKALALKLLINNEYTLAKNIYISILRKTQSNYSIYGNLSVIYAHEEKWHKVIECCNKAIQIKGDYYEGLVNLGIAFRMIGKINESIKTLKKALSIRNNSEILCNLGDSYHEKKDFTNAIKMFNNSLKAKPNNIVYNKLSLSLKEEGSLKEAEENIMKSISIDSNNIETLLLFCQVLYAKKEIYESYKIAEKIYKIESNNNYNIIFLYNLIKSQNKNNLKRIDRNNIINILLDSKNINHNNLFEELDHKTYKEIIRRLMNSKVKIIDNELLKKLTGDKIICKSLKLALFRNLEWERFLIQIRKELLLEISKGNKKYKDFPIDFLVSICEQCDLNEYIYKSSDEELELIKELINEFYHLKNQDIIICILNCYQPISKLQQVLGDLKNINYNSESIKNYIFDALKEEIELKRNSNNITKINKTSSIRIKKQYNENPYPRWKSTNYNPKNKLSSIQIINEEIYPNILKREDELEKNKVLIAGCGTGEQIIYAQRYKNSIITAIDISPRSLLYAYKKIQEYGIINTQLIEMDLLDSNLLETKFDIIESTGVLHHMEDPIKGLAKLISNLKKYGYMKLALYSSKARLSITKIRKSIQSEKLIPTKKNIMLIREKIINSELDLRHEFKQLNDFYNTSMLRDLLFNEIEHQYDILQLKDILEKNNLKFLGFLTTSNIRKKYLEEYPKDHFCKNMTNWNKFEERYPGIFLGMYQFWVQKM